MGILEELSWMEVELTPFSGLESVSSETGKRLFLTHKGSEREWASPARNNDRK